MAGYSGTPLIKKLGIKAPDRVLLLRAPRGYRALLEDVPDGVRFVTSATSSTSMVHAFFSRKAELEKTLASLRRQLSPSAVIWVSWPKKSAGVDTDITEDVVRAAALPLGLVDVKVCAVDDIWSGLKLVVRRELRP
jgi:hypothetical protein